MISVQKDQAQRSDYSRDFLARVYREDVGVSVITFSEKIEPSKPKLRRNPATERGKVSDKKAVAERARAGRLLGSLAKLYATRSQPLFHSRHRIALLTIAGNLLAIVAAHDSREFEPANLHRWARKNVDGATHAEIEQAFEAALRAYRAVPAPSVVGFALELSKYHWLRAGRPWGVHPADMTADDVDQVQRAAKRARDRQRAAAKRAASGATPRELSVSAIARELGISRPTLYKRMKAAGFDDAAAFYSFVARTYKRKYRSDVGVKAPLTQRQLAGGPKAAAATTANQSRASDERRRAARGSQTQGPAQPATRVRAVRAGLIRVANGLRAAPKPVSDGTEPATRAPGGHLLNRPASANVSLRAPTYGPHTRVRTLRARGQSATWDAGIEEGADDYGRGWRTYDLTDAVALSCVLELMDRGLSADVAGSIVANCRGWLAGYHADAPALADTWIGVIHLNGSAGHVGGHLAQVLASVEQQVGRDIRNTKGGGGAALILVNASNHYRRLKEALIDAE